MYKFWDLNGKASQNLIRVKKDMKVEFIRSWAVRAVAAMALTSAAWAGSFGKVVPVGGQASDIALDEARGVLYIANFTSNTIDVMSLADNTIRTSLNVAPQPGSLALSPDGTYLVVAHFGNFANAPANAITVINLAAGNSRQTFALGFPPLGVAFGLDGLCFIVTTTNFVLLDPVSGATQVLDSVANVAKSLPVAVGTFPPNIIGAAVNTSADGLWIYGLTDGLTFSYDVRNKLLRPQTYVSSPTMGPRVMSVADDGSYYVGGWALQSRTGILLQEFPGPMGLLNVGSHALDSKANLLYAEIPSSVVSTGTTPAPVPTVPTNATFNGAPVLGIYDADNLTLREQLNLPEHLAGKSVLTS